MNCGMKDIYDALRAAELNAWEVDGGIVVRGDCIEVIECLHNNKITIDAVITDPPWMPVVKSTIGEKGAKGANELRRWSDMSMLRWAFSHFIRLIRAVQKDGGATCFFCGDIAAALMAQAIYENWARMQLLTWEKPGAFRGRIMPPFTSKNEFVWYCADGVGHPAREMEKTGSVHSPILRAAAAIPSTRIHEAEKPVALLEHLIEICVPRGGIVADFFAGSFSLAKAAKNTGRQFLCVEMDAVYFRRAMERLGESDDTIKQTAVRNWNENGGGLL